MNLLNLLEKLESAVLPVPGGLPVIVVHPGDDAPELAAFLADVERRMARSERVIVVGDDSVDTAMAALVDECAP